MLHYLNVNISVKKVKNFKLEVMNMLKSRFLAVKLALLIFVGISTTANCVFGFHEPVKTVGYFDAHGKLGKFFAALSGGKQKVKQPPVSFNNGKNGKFDYKPLLKTGATISALFIAGVSFAFLINKLTRKAATEESQGSGNGSGPENPGQPVELEENYDYVNVVKDDKDVDQDEIIECSLCWEDKPRKDFVKLDCCGYDACKACLLKDIKTKMNSSTEVQSAADLRCPNPNCKKHRPEFSKKLLEDLMALDFDFYWKTKDKVFEKWQDRKSERLMMNKREVKSGILDKWRRWRNDIQVCPGCGIEIQKNGGCRHMTCENCRCQFCWSCGEFSLRGQPWVHSSFCNSNPVLKKVTDFIDKKIVDPIAKLI